MITHPLHRRRVRLLATAIACALAVLPVACSKSESAASVSADAPILVEPSSSYITFTNRAGQALSDISISIVPYGPGEFTRLFPRVENTGRRQVPVNEFRGRDGTPLNLRVVRPKLVRVKAQDASGKAYSVEVPWKP